MEATIAGTFHDVKVFNLTYFNALPNLRRCQRWRETEQTATTPMPAPNNTIIQSHTGHSGI